MPVEGFDIPPLTIVSENTVSNETYTSTTFTDLKMNPENKNTIFSTRASVFCESPGIPKSWNNPPTFNVSISEGKVSNITIDDPGKGFLGNIEVFFNGGGGYGARAIVSASGSYNTAFTFSDTGKLGKVNIVDSGNGYLSSPEPIIVDVSPTWKSYESNYFTASRIIEHTINTTTSVDDRYVKYIIPRRGRIPVDTYYFYRISWYRFSFFYKNFIPEEVTAEPDGSLLSYTAGGILLYNGGQQLTPIGIAYSRGWLGNVPDRPGSIINLNIKNGGNGYQSNIYRTFEIINGLPIEKIRTRNGISIKFEGGESYDDKTALLPFYYDICYVGNKRMAGDPPAQVNNVTLGANGEIINIGGPIYKGVGFKSPPTVTVTGSGQGAQLEAVIGIEEPGGVPNYAGGGVKSIAHQLHYHYYNGVILTNSTSQWLSLNCNDSFSLPSYILLNNEYLAANSNPQIISSLGKWYYDFATKTLLPIR
jgi:hypothetical protein